LLLQLPLMPRLLMLLLLLLLWLLLAWALGMGCWPSQQQQKHHQQQLCWCLCGPWGSRG
jgi:hypothetical protein